MRRHRLHVALSSLLVLAAVPAAWSQEPLSLQQILDNTGNLSLEPLLVPAPSAAQLNLHVPTPQPGSQVQNLTPLPPAATPTSDFFDAVGRIFEAQDSYWPFGTQTSVHIQAQTDSGVGHWVPFVSLSQDADEVDAHIRNGIGAGLTYRFNKDARVDLEGMFLQHSGDENPQLRDESRVMVVFSLNF